MDSSITTNNKITYEILIQTINLKLQSRFYAIVKIPNASSPTVDVFRTDNFVHKNVVVNPVEIKVTASNVMQHYRQ